MTHAREPIHEVSHQGFDSGYLSTLDIQSSADSLNFQEVPTLFGDMESVEVEKNAFVQGLELYAGAVDLDSESRSPLGRIGWRG
jgi:hypothetical protein